MTSEPRASAPCPFCEIVAGRAPATIVAETPGTIAIVPLDPVVEGHTLIIPRLHVMDFMTSPDVTADVMHAAACFARAEGSWPCNIITSAGREATQTVFHLHVHVVPRRKGDGLPLPWTPQQEAAHA